MTTSPAPQAQPPDLRVVPPRPAPVSPTAAAAPPAAPPTPNTPDSAPNPWMRRGQVGLILLGLGLLGFVPVPYNIGGDTVLEWPEGERQPVRAPMRAIVQEVWVEPGEQVVPGQVLVTLYSHELRREQDDLQRQLAQAERELQEARRGQAQAQGRLQEVEAIARSATLRAERAATRHRQSLQVSDTHPDIAILRSRQQDLHQQLALRSEELKDAEELYREGAGPERDVEQAQLRYEEAQNAIARIDLEIQQVRQRLGDQAQDDASAVTVQLASVDAAAQVAQFGSEIASQENKIQTLQAQLAELASREELLRVTASQTGRVLSENLDLLVGREVDPNTDLLQIANTRILTANVEINEQDLNFIDEGAAVTFRAKSAKLEPYRATVERITRATLTPDATQQRRVATLQVVIENPDERLLPGVSGYAKIASPPLSIYERIGREIIKLWPERFLP